MKKLFDWIEHFANTRYKLHALFVVAFFEQSFSPIVPDILVVPIAMYKKYTAFFVATLAASASLLGGVLTYILAYYYGDDLVNYFNVASQLEYAKNAYSQNVFWAMLVASFTPIPDKIFTIFGGVFKVSFLPFALALFLGKFLRYYIVALVAERYGQKARDILLERVNRVFWYITIIVLAILFVVYFLNK